VRWGNLVNPLKDLFFLEELLVKVERVKLDGLFHGIADFESLDGSSVIGQDWAQLDRFRHQVNCVVDALALYVQDELLLVLVAFKCKFLDVWLVSARSEHDVNSLTLSGHEEAALRPDLEFVTIVPLLVVCCSLRSSARRGCHV